MFTREDGSALHPEYVSRHFERLARNAGLPPIRLHDLRHGAATLALAGGADLKTVSEMLGHSTITITADTYASVLPEVARSAAEAAARLVPRGGQLAEPQRSRPEFKGSTQHLPCWTWSVAMFHRAVIRRFWRLVIQDGVSVEDASAAVSVSWTTGRRWFRDAGGMPPLSIAEPPKRGLWLSLREREEIARCVAQDLSIRQIAKVLGRHPTTVMRELARNGSNRYRRECRPGATLNGWVARTSRYYPSEAQLWAEKRARRYKTAKLAGNQVLREEVQDQLKHNHSPEQIAARLREDFSRRRGAAGVARDHLPVDLRARPRGTETGALARHLRTGRTLRKPRRHANERNGRSGSGGGGHDGDQQVNAQNRAFFTDLPTPSTASSGTTPTHRSY